MHDVPSRPELPSSSCPSMAKVGPDASEATTMAIMSNDDPAVDSEGLSIGSDSTTEPRQPDVTQQLLPGSSLFPQPVTPESPKVAEEVTSPPPFPVPQISDDEKKASESGDLRGVAESAAISDTGVPNDKGDDSNAPPPPIPAPAGFNSAGDVAQTGAQDPPDSSKSRRSRSSKRYDDDGSSSDDDSYFSKDLPGPKSGRSFSYSSAGSGGAMAPPYYPNVNAARESAERESDASLSFSDESDDEMQHHHHHQGVRISPMVQPRGVVADMNLYPQRITRMHSVSSLVSSGSSDDGNGDKPAAPKSSASSVSSYATSGTTSDPSVKAELQEVGVEGRPPSQFSEASGRRSPVMGQHGIPGYFYSSPSPIMSPPPIMQGYLSKQGGISHPQPQPYSQEQMAAWVQGGSSPAYGMGGHVQDYGATSQMIFAPHEGGFRNVGDAYPPISYSYSGEDESDDAPIFNRVAGGPGPPGPMYPSQNDRAPIGATSNRTPVAPVASNGPAQGTRNPPQSSAAVDTAEGGVRPAYKKPLHEDRGFKVYWRRWLMLLYMSVLNLLSDWTCYSVAPISLLTEEAFGNIDPERLVVVFLGANSIASICEPIILSRLGLRRTVLFGALLLMIGSIVKSGSVPPILQSDIMEGESGWRLYLGFFLVGLSQPLYQCTPTLLSSSWFPEEERTMATGVALNANQLGIGFAFVFGTLLVENKYDIIPYFGLLSTLSTLVFMGALIQFDDAPPTPPSASARVVRGTLDMKLPNINEIVESVRVGLSPADTVPAPMFGSAAAAPSPAASGSVDPATTSNKASKSKKGQKGGTTRRRATGSRSSAIKDSGLMAPSSALPWSTAEALAEMAVIKSEASRAGVTPPSPMMPGRSDLPESSSEQRNESEQSPLYQDAPAGQQNQPGLGHPYQQGDNPMYPPGFPGMVPPGMAPPFGAPMHPQYQYPYWDPRFQQQMQQQQAFYQQQYYYHQQPQYPPPPYYFPRSPYPPPYLQGYDYAHAAFPAVSDLDDGAEPILTITPRHLDIDIRDDQVIRSLKACFARQGFMHALVAFTASGIVINTLSTYMDYLVRLNGAPRAYTGIVGGTFQFVIMISSLIIGKFTDKSRAYYSVTIGMLVLGAFGLAECGVSLDSDRGNDLRVCLIVVAALVGPLQPVSTELGVDVVYPLSENTVLVIQQLFSNLLSACFIPVFKALKDVGSHAVENAEMFERPQYTFSFYLLIVIHTAATVFFATFNGKYLRYEHELERKAEEEEQDEIERQEDETDRQQYEAMHPFHRGGRANERQPLVSTHV